MKSSRPWMRGSRRTGERRPDYVLVFGIADAEFLDLPGNRVAAHAEEVRRLDAPAAGARESAHDERALELARKLIDHPDFPAREAALHLLLQRGDPVRCRLCRDGALVAKLRRQVGAPDRLARRHDGEPMAEVFELTHVAREIHPGDV